MIVTLIPTANAAETGAGLTNPNNAMSGVDTTYATALPGKNTTLATKYQNFGFEDWIDSRATITKVELIFTYNISTTASIATARCYAKVSGVAKANHDDATEPAGNTTTTYDITADDTWTYAKLKNGVFEVALSAVQGGSSTAVTFNFDSIQVRVTFNKGTTKFNNYQSVRAISTGITSVGERIK